MTQRSVHVAVLAAVLAVACAPLPQGTTVRISPEEPQSSDDLVARLEGDVGALGKVTWAWSWLRDGSPTEFDGTTIPAEATADGETWRAIAFPTAGSRRGAAISAQVTIGEEEDTTVLPGEVRLSPTQPRTTDDIVATAVSEDPDATFTYAWTLDGGGVDETSDTLRASATRKGQRVQVIATPSAGEPLVSDPVTVVNSAPSAPSVRLSPEDALVSEDLRCTLSATSRDADGDSLDYTMSWQVDGAAFSGATTSEVWTSDTVPAAELADGQRWTCTATASDGEARSHASSPSNAVTVRNTDTLVPGNTRITRSAAGWTIRCIEWRGEVCTHVQVKLACTACDRYEDCDTWHDVTRYNDDDDRTALNLCALATGDEAIDAVGSGGGASAPAACGLYEEDLPICVEPRAAASMPGVGDGHLGLVLHPSYCDEDPTLLHVACAGW